MDTDLALLHQKVDHLIEQVETQRNRLETLETSRGSSELVQLHKKLDYVIEQMETEKKGRQAFDELKDDLIPIVNHMIKLAIDELAEIGTEFQLEDLLFLLKRLLRNTDMLLEAIDRIEALMGLADEMGMLGKQVFNQAVENLDHLERQGYFDFVRGGMYITERIVTEFDEKDLHALGDDIVTILTTVRDMTQPEVLALVNNAIGAVREETPAPEAISAWALLRELSDPKVRVGLARLLNLVKVMGEQT